MNHDKLRWAAVYLIVVLMIGLAFLLIVWSAEPGSAYHGMNWVWEIA